MLLFFKKNNKCFALKQAQYATVIRYMSRVPFRRMVVPPFSIPKMSMALQTPTHPARLHSALSCRGRPCSDDSRRARPCSFHWTYQHSTPLGQPSHCMVVVCDSLPPQALNHTEEIYEYCLINQSSINQKITDSHHTYTPTHTYTQRQYSRHLQIMNRGGNHTGNLRTFRYLLKTSTRVLRTALHG